MASGRLEDLSGDSSTSSRDVHQKISAAKEGDWTAMDELACGVDVVPAQSLQSLVDALFVHLKAPIPDELCVLKNSETLRYARSIHVSEQSLTQVSQNAFWAIRCLAVMHVGRIINSTKNPRRSSSIPNKLADTAHQVWPYARLWIAHLNHYIYNIVVPNTPAKQVVQVAILAITAFISTMMDIDSLRFTIAEDGNILHMVLSLWMKQDLNTTMRLNLPQWPVHTPARVLSEIVPLFRKTRSKNSLAILKVVDGYISKLLVQRLRLTSLGRTVNIHSLSAYLTLLRLLPNCESTMRHVACPSGTAAIVATLRLYVARHPRHSLHLFSADVMMLFFGLTAAFESSSSDTCFRAALREDVLSVFAELTAVVDKSIKIFPSHAGVYKDFAAAVATLLVYSAGHTSLISASGRTASAANRVLKVNPGVTQSTSIGQQWVLLTRQSLERATCKWLFNEARKRRIVRCSSCANVFPRLALSLCSVCKIERYCSLQCQQTAWFQKGHREACRQSSPKLAASLRQKRTIGFLQFLATVDVKRHRDWISKKVATMGPNLTPGDVYVSLDYSKSQSRDLDFIDIMILGNDREAIIMKNMYRNGLNGPNSCILVKLTAPHCSGIGRGSLVFPIDVRNCFALCKEKSKLQRCDSDGVAGDVITGDGEGMWAGRLTFQTADGEKLSSLFDVVDRILLESERIVEHRPDDYDGELSEIVKDAAGRVEEEFRKNGQDMYRVFGAV